MWVTKLLISPLKKKDFLPKNDKIWHEIGIYVHWWLIWCPVGGMAGGCGAGWISQDTYLLYLSDILVNNKHISATCNYCNRVGCMCTELVTGGMGEIVLQITTKD